MSESDHVKALIKEAETYRKQGLLNQAKAKYMDLLNFVENHEKFSKDKKLIDALNSKIKAVDNTLTEIDQAGETPELPEKVQDLISKLFSFSRNKDTAAIEGALALAKFGQYERAIAEFQRLIKAGTLPQVAASNMLSCHLTFSTPEAAVSQFKEWVAGDTFSKGDLKYLRGFLQNMLEKKGIRADLPEVSEAAPGEVKPAPKEEEVIDISSLCIALPGGPRKGEVVEFEVTFQSGNAISIIIPSKEKGILEAFKAGLRLSDMQCYSAMGVFNGSGVVSSKSMISSGPKRGDHTMDITIDGG